MPDRSAIARLADIVEACERVRALLCGVPLEVFEADWSNQWIVERGIEIVSEASRHLPVDMKERHPQIPWPKVAGIGNVLRHNYEHVSSAILWTLVQTELTDLEQACREELARELAKGQPES
jgi:uncharacterized protein with HEPN domain